MGTPLWTGPRLDSPPKWNLQKLDLVRMGAPSPESGHGQVRHWTRQNWTRNTKLDAPKPTRNCVSNFAFSDPKSNPNFGIIGRAKTDIECDHKKKWTQSDFSAMCPFVHFSKLFKHEKLDAGPFENWTRKKMDAGLKKQKLDAPFRA